MQRKLPWNLIVIWLVASTLAVIACTVNSSAAQLNGEYLPIGNDGFYHARRILDAVREPGSFYEFDAKIHAPEGSLLTWPWGYDYALAALVRGGLAVGLSDDPMAILIWIPVATVLFSVGLLIVIARQLGLSTPLTALAALCIALSPTTQLLHGTGQIDHHYAELISILGVLAAGLAWLRKPESARRALAAAVVLGLVPAVHNGLFILQLPLLVALFVLWLHGRAAPARIGLLFAAALLLTSLAILLPSEPFQLRRFEFYTLSWFHLYIALCSAVTVALLTRLKAGRNGIVILLSISTVLLVPILKELPIAQDFVAGTPEYLQMVSEMKSPWQLARIMSPTAVSNYYSYLIWITPLTALLCAFKGWRERGTPRLLFWITSLMGLAMLSLQVRMQYFGSFALYLPWLVLLQQYCDRFPQYFRKAVLLGSLALLLLYFPPLRHQLVSPMVVTNDISFREIRPLLGSLAQACVEDPGIVLADTDAGHYIRYYTECSVIANNFLLTPQHFAKVEEVQDLFRLTATELQARAPHVKYVLVRPAEIRQTADGALKYLFLVLEDPRLPMELLLGPQSAVPAGFTLLGEVRLPELGNVPYAKLYRIERDGARAMQPSKSSAIDVGE